MGWSKLLMRAALGEYQLYRIYGIVPSEESSEPEDARVKRIDNADDLLESRYPEIRSLHAYAGNDAYGYGCWRDGELVSACWYWVGQRYKQERGFWPLKDKEAKLVQISTAPAARGCGLAQALLMNSARDMAMRGYNRLYSRIWHSNLASIRLFEKCRWRYTAFVAEIYPFGLKWKLRFLRRKERPT